jgi:hypothetical protein
MTTAKTMSSNLRSSTIVCGAIVLTLSTGLPHAQVRRPPGQGREPVPVTVSLKIGGGSYSSSTAGSCTHAPTASIYGVLSEMWSVRQQDEGRSVALTMWRSKKDGEETFNLSVNDKKSVRINTVRGGQGSGTGTIKLQPSGKGGTFTVDGKTDAGEAVSGTISCAAFTAAVAEGG